MKVLDLFSGIGGFSLGLERAGMQTVAFCEIDPFCRQVLRKYWPDVPIFEDVRTLTAADVPGADLICGGWPCQTYSTAAHGNNTHADMWGDFYRIIREVRPTWVLAENVPRTLYGFDGIRSDLQSAGYVAAAINTDTALPERQRGRHRAIYVAHADGDSESWRSFYAKAPGLPTAATGVWEAMPEALGVADGVPERVDRRRMKALGNAICPQIPEIIGKAILCAS